MHRTTLCTAVLLSLLSAAAIAQDALPPQSTVQRAEARHKMRTACATDIQKFCANIERAKGAMRACLDLNQASLSAECNAARAERAAHRAKDKS